jgi:5-formyltetrahydrofolate cyclo-ligase
MSIAEEKKALRKHIAALKKTAGVDDKKHWSHEIMEQVEQLTEFQEASTVLAYWSMDDEVFTHDFIRKWYRFKTILLPSVLGDEMILKIYHGDDNLKEGDRFGIPEPEGFAFTDYQAIDIMLIPGVAFDENNNRMGRGKAFYDKFLCQTHAFKTGLAFAFQVLPAIPVDEFDIKMDLVLYK